jgi:hypothetical protein
MNPSARIGQDSPLWDNLFAIYDPPILFWEYVLFFTLLAVVLICLILIWVGPPALRWPRTGAWISGSISFLIVIALLIPPVARVREATAPTIVRNRLKQLVLAMHSYADTHDGRLPPAAVYGADGRPLLSWRVLLLPYLEQDKLYGRFHLDKAWDSPENLPLLSQMPSEFAHPAEMDLQVEPFSTFFQVFVGKGTAFEGKQGLRIRDDFADGFANTIIVVEAENSVPWTKPADISYEPQRPLHSLGGVFQARFNGWFAVTGDASLRVVRPGVMNEETIRNAITRNDGKQLGPDWSE